MRLNLRANVSTRFLVAACGLVVRFTNDDRVSVWVAGAESAKPRAACRGFADSAPATPTRTAFVKRTTKPQAALALTANRGRNSRNRCRRRPPAEAAAAG